MSNPVTPGSLTDPASWHPLQPQPQQPPSPRAAVRAFAGPVITRMESSRTALLIELRNGYHLTVSPSVIVVTPGPGRVPVFSLPLRPVAIPPPGRSLLAACHSEELPGFYSFAEVTLHSGPHLCLDDDALLLWPSVAAAQDPDTLASHSFKFPPLPACEDDDRDTAEVPHSDDYPQPLALA